MAEDLVAIKLFEESFTEFSESEGMVRELAMYLRNLFRIFALQASNCGDPTSESSLLSAENEVSYDGDDTTSIKIYVKYSTVVKSRNVTVGFLQSALQVIKKPIQIIPPTNIEVVGGDPNVFVWTASCVLTGKAIGTLRKVIKEQARAEAEAKETVEEALQRQKAELEFKLYEEEREEVRRRPGPLRRRERRTITSVKPIARIIVKTKETEKERSEILKRYAPPPVPRSVVGAIWSYVTNKKQEPKPTSYGDSYAFDNGLFLDGAY